MTKLSLLHFIGPKLGDDDDVNHYILTYSSHHYISNTLSRVMHRNLYFELMGYLLKSNTCQWYRTTHRNRWIRFPLKPFFRQWISVAGYVTYFDYQVNGGTSIVKCDILIWIFCFLVRWEVHFPLFYLSTSLDLKCNVTRRKWSSIIVE